MTTNEFGYCFNVPFCHPSVDVSTYKIIYISLTFKVLNEPVYGLSMKSILGHVFFFSIFYLFILICKQFDKYIDSLAGLQNEIYHTAFPHQSNIWPFCDETLSYANTVNNLTLIMN